MRQLLEEQAAMLIGYARVSTVHQDNGLDAQLVALAGCDRLFQEQVGATAARRQLELALSMLRPGDCLAVTKLDRLARSVADLMTIRKRIEEAGASLRVLGLNLDTATATGKLMMTMLGAVSEFEREMMLERQREGIQRAKAAGRYKGRKALGADKAAAVRSLKEQGLGATEIAKRLSIGRASVYRLLDNGRSV